MINPMRLLPVLVAVASLALVARVADVWQGIEAMAQETPVSQQEGVQNEGATEGAEAVDSGAELSEEFKLPADPLSMTDEEVSLLQELSERREEIERRGRRLEQREILLQAAERRIEEKVAGLKELQKLVEGLLEEQNEKTESQYNSLVKIYENMKPKSAARIFEELELEVLLPVIQRMKERKVAPILAKMNAEKAKTITTKLAQQRRLPENG